MKVYRSLMSKMMTDKGDERERDEEEKVTLARAEVEANVDEEEQQKQTRTSIIEMYNKQKRRPEGTINKYLLDRLSSIL